MDGKATKADASLRIAQRLLWARSGHTGFPEAAVATNVRSQVACPAQVGQLLPFNYSGKRPFERPLYFGSGQMANSHTSAKTDAQHLSWQ